MRWLIRMALFWAVSLPLFYLFALPFLLGQLSAKAQTQGYAACLVQLREQGLTESPIAPLRPIDGQNYCHCVTDGLQFTRADLPELVQHQTPARLTEVQKPVIEACNAALQAAMNETIRQAPATSSTFDADGTETIHFN